MSNWSDKIGGTLSISSGSAPTNIPKGFIAIYTSGSDGSLYYQASGSAAVKIG